MGGLQFGDIQNINGYMTPEMDEYQKFNLLNRENQNKVITLIESLKADQCTPSL